MLFEGTREEDVRTILDVMGDCFNCKREDYLKKILAKLAAMFLSQPAFCAISSAGSFSLEALIQRGLPQKLLQPYLAGNPSCRETFVRSVLPGEGVNLVNLRDIPFEKRIHELNTACGVDSCIVGRFRDSDLRTMLLCIPNPAKPPRTEQLNLLGLVFPHLHHVMRTLLLQPRPAKPDLLSRRESEVLEWAAGGKTNWEISKILAITEDTIKFHLKNIYRKLNACNRGHAIAKAFQLGIVKEPEPSQQILEKPHPASPQSAQVIVPGVAGTERLQEQPFQF